MSQLPIALQTYTVRDQIEKDVAGTLKAIADIGYKNLELAGTGGATFAEFRKMADDVGLNIVSAHLGLPEEGALSELVDNAATLGLSFVVTGMPGDLRSSGDGYRTHATNCEKAARALKEHSITLCYHNHSFEFEVFDGKYGLDILYEDSAPDSLQAQLDVYWVQHGNVDPAEYILKWKDRCKLLHLKDMLADEKRSFAEVGEGILDWPAIFKAAEETDVAWYIVEQDTCARPTLASAKLSFENLKKWGYA